MNPEEMREIYRRRYDSVLVPLANRLETHLRVLVNGLPRIDKVAVRAKSEESFMGKASKVANDGTLKYSDPLNQIQDQIGARIVTYYLSDVNTIAERIEEYLSRIEAKTVVPDDLSKFGYEGKHYILFIPQDVRPDPESKECPTFFELQIKTLFQHAWGETEHDLGYKVKDSLTDEQGRRLAFTAAQAWGADWIFNELAGELLP